MAVTTCPSYMTSLSIVANLTLNLEMYTMHPNMAYISLYKLIVKLRVFPGVTEMVKLTI